MSNGLRIEKKKKKKKNEKVCFVMKYLSKNIILTFIKLK